MSTFLKQRLIIIISRWLLAAKWCHFLNLFCVCIDFSFCKARGLREALQNENLIRKQYSTSSDVLYSLEELQLGAGGELTKLSQGRRLQLTLGGQGSSRFSYRSVLLDAEETSDPFTYHCGVFIVPNVCSLVFVYEFKLIPDQVKICICISSHKLQCKSVNFPFNFLHGDTDKTLNVASSISVYKIIKKLITDRYQLEWILMLLYMV